MRIKRDNLRHLNMHGHNSGTGVGLNQQEQPKQQKSRTVHKERQSERGGRGPFTQRANLNHIWIHFPMPGPDWAEISRCHIVERKWISGEETLPASRRWLVRGIINGVPQSTDTNLLRVILDSWDRNNRIMVNLLRALPPGGHAARVTPTSPSVAELFAHVVYVRLIFVFESAPEWSPTDTPDGWLSETDPERLAAGLDSSARAVRDAVENRLQQGRPLEQHYDHPLLFLQHMIWHEGYHHGQIKLALKLNGHTLQDDEIGPLTWDLWIEKTGAA